MSLELKDRIPTRPNRKLITPEGGGAPYFATVVHADEPVEVGTPINKATLNNVLTEANIFTTSRTGINAKETQPWSETLYQSLIEGITTTITHYTFVAIRDFKQGNEYYRRDPVAGATLLTITDLAGEPLNDGVWKVGSPVSLIIQGDKAFFKGGSVSINDTLPSLPIFSLSPKSSSLIINFTELSDVDYPYLMDYVFVYKTGSYPTGYKDGIPIIISKEQSGKDRSFEISNLISGETYYFRVFTRNFKKQIQTMIIDAFRKIKIGYEEPYTLEPLSVPRYYATSSPLADGVGAFGGSNNEIFYDTVDFYDSNKIRSTLTPLSEAREALTSSPLADGVIVSGGATSGRVWNVSDFYDNNKIHSTLTPLSVARYRLTSSPLSNGVAIFGGTGVIYSVDTVDFYDSDKTRSILASLPQSRGLATSSPLADGVIVSGGGTGENNKESLNTSDFYNKDKVRTTLQSLSVARKELTSSPLADGVIVSGGFANSASSVSDFYDKDKVRTALTPLSVARYRLTSSPLADGVIVSGGDGGSKVVDFYNKDKVRTTLQSLSTSKSAATSSPLADGVAIFGHESVDFYPEASTIPQT